MALVYVTGVPGAGKSAVRRSLQDRGFEAHDTDQNGNAAWTDRHTGEVIGSFASAEQRTPEWHERYVWELVPKKVQALADRAHDRVVFLCGSVANEKAVWHFFDKVIYLDIDDATLKERLASRKGNDFGKSDHEFKAIMEWRKIGADDYRDFGATVVDATQTLDAVVQNVIRIAISG